jgi:hypothetical protein
VGICFSYLVGFRNGQEIQVFTSRFYTIEKSKESLSKYFRAVDAIRNPQLKEVLFVLKTHSDQLDYFLSVFKNHVYHESLPNGGHKEFYYLGNLI